MRPRSILLVAVAFSIASPLCAQQTTATTGPAPDAKTTKPRQVCRQIGDTGSHFVKRVCHTADQWAIIDAAESGGPQRSGTDSARR